MKHVVLWQGGGNNESQWARLISALPSDVHIMLQGLTASEEHWLCGTKVAQSKVRRIWPPRKLDDACLNQISGFKLFIRTLRILRFRRCDVAIMEANRATFGLLMRAFGLTRKIVVVISDYLCPQGPWYIRWHRRAVWALTCFVTRRADEVWIVSPRIPVARLNPHLYVAPIFIEGEEREHPVSLKEIAYIGVPSPDHALDMLFIAAQKHGLIVHVIGDSPYLQTIAHLAPASTQFHGTVTDRQRIMSLIKNCFCGYAVYRNTSTSSYSYYGVPSKAFNYFANGIPVISTLAGHFTECIEEYGIGKIVEPRLEQIESAIQELRENNEQYHQAVRAFKANWNAGVQEHIRLSMDRLLSPRMQGMAAAVISDAGEQR